MQTDDPLLAAARLVAEAGEIKAEFDRLLLHSRTEARTRRARELRQRAREIASSIGDLLTREHALEMVIKDRLGRVDVEGVTILPVDEAAADLLLAKFGLGT